MTIWCNAAFSAPAEQRLVFAHTRSASVLVAGPSDPGPPTADVVFGQP